MRDLKGKFHLRYFVRIHQVATLSIHLETFFGYESIHVFFVSELRLCNFHVLASIGSEDVVGLRIRVLIAWTLLWDQPQLCRGRHKDTCRCQVFLMLFITRHFGGRF